jgi:hypothetical protein
MDTAELIDIGLATMTGLLALGTFWMARKTSALAELGQRQHDEATTPILRLHRTSPPGTVALNDIGDQSFTAVLENVGPAAADFESCHLTNIGPAKLLNEGIASPRVGADEGLHLVFTIDPAARTRMTTGMEQVATITYRGTKSGLRFKVVEKVRWDLETMTWRLIDAGAPTAD